MKNENNVLIRQVISNKARELLEILQMVKYAFDCDAEKDRLGAGLSYLHKYKDVDELLGHAFYQMENFLNFSKYVVKNADEIKNVQERYVRELKTFDKIN